MKKKIIVSAVFAACVLGMGGCAEDSASKTEFTQATAAATHREVVRVSEPPHEMGSSTVVPKQVPASEVLNAPNPSLLALSVEEAAWLDRQGYPTPEELDAVMTYDAEQLGSATRNRKSLKAAALLGHRRMKEGDIDGAWAAFSAGASFGSLYARQQMAMVTTHQVTGLPLDQMERADPGNLGVMLAQFEVARMLGDHRAQALIDRYGVNFDWDHYGKHVLTQTARFMDDYGEFARARGERVKGPDPRPNAEAWAQLAEDPDALVTVYTRGSTGP